MGRHGDPAWPAFLERLGLTAAGALLVATTVRRRTGGFPPPAHAAPAPIRRIAYAGCLAWLPYGGVHLLSAFGVPGLEPEGFRPTAGMAVALCAGLGLAGAVRWHGRTGLDALGFIGLAQPISFAGYGLALTACAVSYQLRTRPTPPTVPPEAAV